MFQPRILSFLSVAFFVLSAITHVNALLRFPCSQLVTQRFDPLVTPGQVSPHVHQIVGGNAFNLTMDPELDLGKLATCTTCRFKEDKSNYWTAVLYFKHPNGSYIRVPQMANHYTGAPNGGMTVYYFQPRPPTKDLKVVAFRKGFRMIVGDPMRRRDDLSPSVTAHKQLTFRCFQGNALGAGTPGVGPDDTIDLPKRFCSGGIRSNIYFPQCWDGMNLDSPDHAVRPPLLIGVKPRWYSLPTEPRRPPCGHCFPRRSTDLWHRLPGEPPSPSSSPVHGNCMGHSTVQSTRTLARGRTTAFRFQHGRSDWIRPAR
ncbi:hypothetical protein CC2G_001718 [Coprinopsis cinerea AmutBmut pab1-1]|nr:hypothetical protein CC2G_001718 [Coprinopsis cinerea AmutBmut pab1-1]